MNEKQKRVVRAMEKFFENFRKKQVAVAKRAAGNKTKKRRS